jgi:hypothetical protein
LRLGKGAPFEADKEPLVKLDDDMPPDRPTPNLGGSAVFHDPCRTGSSTLRQLESMVCDCDTVPSIVENCI